MVSKETLEAMAQASIKGMDPGTLPDLPDVKISGEAPAERLESLLSQVENPYCFRVGKTPVKILFSGEKSIESALKSHFLSLKCKDFSAEK